MRNKIAAALAVVLVSVSTAAMADFTYEIPLWGYSTSSRDLVFLPGGGTNLDGPVVVTLPYLGDLEVTVSSSADGFYYETGITMQIDLLASNNVTFGTGVFTTTWEHEVEVTVVNGMVTDLTTFYQTTFEHWKVSDGNIDFRGNTNHDSFEIVASMVPEPAEGLMLLAGLAAVLRPCRRQFNQPKAVSGL